jgi:hypothetical protein
MAKTNPNFFAVKTTVVLNSDSEIVEEDPEGARIHVRSKRTGEESIVSVNKDKQIVNSRYDPSVPFLPKPAEQTKEEEKK